MSQHSIAIIGVGKIAIDQHLPVIAKNPAFRLAALVSQRGVQQPGVPTFATPAELYAALPDLDAVAICTPPSVRHAVALEALAAGKHVMLEKPPAPTVSELADLERHAGAGKRVLFATWHSQYNAGVDEARRRLAGQKIAALAITWKEDVKRWHPGQEWIWQPGGFGVFDPGINALSILTRIVPEPFFVSAAKLVYPANRDTPIAASLRFSSTAAEPGAPLTAEFDWRQTGDQTWTIEIRTAAGSVLTLIDGGSKLAVDGTLVVSEPMAEYEAIYARFAGLLDRGESAVDAAPFHLVADAMLVGARETTDAFDW
ncbi:Gfo/Idh/MocA family protein [Labrys monachus]|uniref:D-galactose 1-dehydrogenase n=1 Tax=Labrys monachus TaxID=217067 RepID=A0ABU0FN51_9HYPH|nr:Gfo/Idh/MocA family oxidoreductase [Labrys monachus]MDQ0396040.1 D-galactose 1-dehydrogenase [Labrys monachus]